MTHKFVNTILWKTCSSLVKIISVGEINFEQNKYNKFQKISASFAKNKCKYGIINSSITVCFKTKFTYLLKYTVSGTSFLKGEYVTRENSHTRLGKF